MKRFLILGGLGFFLGVLVGAFTHPTPPSLSTSGSDSLSASQAYAIHADRGAH